MDSQRTDSSSCGICYHGEGRRGDVVLRARDQVCELRLKVLTHNVMILLRIEVFYSAVLPPFSPALRFQAFLR